MIADKLTTSKNSQETVSVLQRKLYLKAKHQTTFRFYSLYDKVYRRDILQRAFDLVRQNQGSPGIDGETFAAIETGIGKQAYCQEIQEALKANTYRAMPVKRVEIPKPNGETRPLGIPCIKDRIVQMAVKLVIEPIFEADFSPNSYGFRPKRSAHQAMDAIKEGLLKGHAQVIDADLSKYFDTIPHDKLLRAVAERIVDSRILSLLKKWLKVPVVKVDRGTENIIGGVISPVLSNLFMHYAFDKWMERQFPEQPFCRYADDGLVHCQEEAEAKAIKSALAKRLQECGLEMHPDKTKIVYCKDDDRTEEHSITSFDFLGYTFRPRRSKNQWGKYFINFSPAMSAKAGKAIRQEVRSWKLHLRSDKSLLDLSRMFKANIQGWINYYGRFYKSAMYPTLRHINRKLCLWATRKYKKLKHHRRRAEYRLGSIAKMHPGMFPHWKLGVRPTVG